MKTDLHCRQTHHTPVSDEQRSTQQLLPKSTLRLRRVERWLIAGVAIVGLTEMLSAATVIAPNQPINGISQAELSARWWKWMISYPVGTNPSQDTTGAFGSVGSSQSVTSHPDIFFIAGNFSPTPDFPARSFVVPAGQSLFFPLVTSASSIPFFGITEPEIRLDAAASLGTVSNLFARLDGVNLDTPANLLNYHQLSPPGLFYLYFPADNIFGVPPGSYPSVTNGYFVGLAPLAPGSYELQFGGQGTGSGGFNTAQAIHLTVLPEPSSLLLIAFCGALTLSARRLRSTPNTNFANLANNQTVNHITQNYGVTPISPSISA
jgi:hypothetical protein